MATPNGTTLEQTRQLEHSVKKEDWDSENYNGPLNVVLWPAWNTSDGVALPPELPPYYWWGYYRSRDMVLLSTPNKEAMWSTAIGIAIAKMASMGWEIESNSRLKRKRTQQMFLNAGAGLGLFGWTKFLAAHLQSYLCTGFGFIEIERATPANGSRVINIHHLNPLRCRLTGNPNRPVRYLARDGETRDLSWHQIILLTDMFDPTEGEHGQVMSAAARAYKQITKLAAIETFVYEKVTGRKPLAMHFLGGATARSVNDAIESAQNEATRKGLSVYMGAAIIPVPTDAGIQLVSVPLAELPDPFNPEQERERADLIYANAIGLDVQDLNPALVGRRNIGTGTQAGILAEKAKGHGLAYWRQQITHELNQLALDDKTLFSFAEFDIADELAEAEVANERQDVRDKQIASGMITSTEARNLAVDAGDLPNEYIEEDLTAGGTLSDDDKPEEEAPAGAVSEERL